MDHFPHKRINYYNDVRDFNQHLLDSRLITLEEYSDRSLKLDLAEHEERKLLRRNKMSIQPNKITVENINKLVELHNVCMKCQEIYTISLYTESVGINEAYDAHVALDDARKKFDAYVKSLTEVQQ